MTLKMVIGFGFISLVFQNILEWMCTNVVFVLLHKSTDQKWKMKIYLWFIKYSIALEFTTDCFMTKTFRSYQQTRVFNTKTDTIIIKQAFDEWRNLTLKNLTWKMCHFKWHEFKCIKFANNVSWNVSKSGFHTDFGLSANELVTWTVSTLNIQCSAR